MDMEFIKFDANKEQEKAFKKLIKCFKECEKQGLVFYGKQYALVAYTKECNNYFNKDKNYGLVGGGRQLPNLSSNVLFDSGADDFPCFLTKEDESMYNEI